MSPIGSYRACWTAALVAIVLLAGPGPRGAPLACTDDIEWQAMDCMPPGDVRDDAQPTWVDLVGDPTHPTFFVGLDDHHVHLRLRVAGHAPGGLGHAVWGAEVLATDGTTALLLLNGKDFKVEIRRTSGPQFAMPTWMDHVRVRHVGDGTDDVFVEFALPMHAMISTGVIADAAGAAELLYRPITGTSDVMIVKDWLDQCRYVPATTLAVTGTGPSEPMPVNRTTPVQLTFTVQNTGPTAAREVVLAMDPLPAWLASPVVTVTPSDPALAFTVDGTTPPLVHMPLLPVGASVVLVLDAEAAPGCEAVDEVASLEASAANAAAASADVPLPLTRDVPERCDGIDDDCDGTTDDDTLAECDDANPCTTDACTEGACSHAAIEGCVRCETDQDCADGGGCTQDACVEGVCRHETLPGCIPCDGVDDCEDRDPCTTEICSAEGVCGHEAVPGCVPCEVAEDCDDGNACTTDLCGMTANCTTLEIPGCVRCETAADCDDANECTQDACTAGACTHEPLVGCGVCVPAAELCANGIDEDCDGLTDCADPNCGGAVACLRTPEICTNCADDDGDGLVDGEDPDCCDSVAGLVVKRLMVAPMQGRLRIRTRGPGFDVTDFDPMTQDTGLQLRDMDGQVFCSCVPPEYWRHARHDFLYHDRAGAFPGQLHKARFRMRSLARVRFRGMGEEMSIRAVRGGQIHIVLRVGRQCLYATRDMRLHAGRYRTP